MCRVCKVIPWYPLIKAAKFAMTSSDAAFPEVIHQSSGKALLDSSFNCSLCEIIVKNLMPSESLQSENQSLERDGGLAQSNSRVFLTVSMGISDTYLPYTYTTLRYYAFATFRVRLGDYPAQAEFRISVSEGQYALELCRLLVT
jgi:hypothetical protein